MHKFASGLKPAVKMVRAVLEVEDLVWSENTEQPEPAAEPEPAGSKEELASNSGGLRSQGRDEAHPKGGEQVATGCREEPGILDPPDPISPVSQ